VSSARGAPAQLLDGAHFAATIAELAVADLIQMLLLTGKQAVITVTCDGIASQVWCAAGEIVDAESGRWRGTAALYRILGFEHATLVAAWRDFSRPRSISGNPTRLLLEGARRKDESDVLRGKLGGAQRRYRHAQAAPEPTGLSAPELALLCSLSEARTVSDVLASSEQGELETLMLLDRWIDAGVLVDEGPRATPTLAAVEASIAPRPTHNRQTLAARGASWAAALRQVRPFWLSGVLAALVLVPGAYWLGTSSAQRLVQRAARAAEPSAAPALVEAAPPTYTVQVQVEPADAHIVLDGAPPAQGHLEASVLRNGLVHELHVTAPGFIPTSVRFLDTAPPQQLRLEPLPLPAPACDAPSAAPSSDVEAGAHGKLYRRGSAAVRGQTRAPAPAVKRPQPESHEPREPMVELIK
jgi:hypothetical protein